MTARDPHARAVGAWLAGVAQRPDADLLASFEGAFAAVWLRARETLGEITLIAVTERVLSDATALFPGFVGAEIDESGMRCGPARERLRSMSVADVRAATSFFLMTWLTVLGNLTADILTPALHQALASAASEPSSSGAARHGKDRRQ